MFRAFPATGFDEGIGFYKTKDLKSSERSRFAHQVLVLLPGFLYFSIFKR